jgi:hypothetical protein
MSRQQFVIVGTVLAVTGLIVVALTCNTPATAAPPKDEPSVRTIPEKARPTGKAVYQGQLRGYVCRADTFGFVITDGLRDEAGFYVVNNAQNKYIIDTVLHAARAKQDLRIYYDEKTSMVEAVEMWHF